MRKDKKVQNTPGLWIHIHHEEKGVQAVAYIHKEVGNKGWSLDYRRFAVTNRRKTRR